MHNRIGDAKAIPRQMVKTVAANLWAGSFGPPRSGSRRDRGCSSAARSRAASAASGTGPARAPPGVHSLDVRNPDEEAAHPVWVRLCLERDGRLVVGRTASDVDDD